MKAVVPAAGRGTRLKPLTNRKPKGLVEVKGTPILTYCFEQLVDLGAEEIVVVVGYKAGDIIDYYGNDFEATRLSYVRQNDRKGLAHALLQADKHIKNDFILMNGDNIFRANLDGPIRQQQKDGIDVSLLVEEVSTEEARKTGVFELNEDGEITSMVEKPDNPPSNLVATGFYALPPLVFEACRLTEPSERGEYELSDAIDHLLHTGATIKPVSLEGWRVNINTLEDVKRAEKRLGE